MKKLLKYISIAVTVSVLTGVGIGLLPQTVQAACGNGYSYCEQLTIDHTQAGSSDTSNWVGLFSTSTDASLATVSHSGHVNNLTTETGSSYTGSVPADLIVTSDSGCATLLNWEVESYSSTTGATILWFNWGTLSHTTDGHPYICYGGSATTWQGNTNGTWPSKYKEVWHLADSSMNIGQSSIDSTASNNNLLNGTKGVSGNTQNTTPTTGQIDGAAYYQASNEYNGAAASSTAVTGTGTGSVSMEALVNFNSVTSYDAGSNEPFQIYYTGSGGEYLGLQTVGDAHLRANYYSNFGGNQPVTASSTISTGTWYVVVITDDNTTLSYYMNGTLIGSTAVGQTRSGDGMVWTGYSPQGQRNSDIKLDEIRILNTAMSADNVTADYNNQKTGSTMVIAGAEQTGGGGSPATPAFIQFGLNQLLVIQA